ncbi:MAG: radical SAM family heme chaperone HemW [Alphaproteobacteria bacterium]|nr:radical SAM family heme chaperone HemW [Alphaproteobacteria bacterium]
MGKSPLSLYIHWPFCLSKCPYCDFNSHVRQTINEMAWQNALIHELKRTFEQTGPRELQSIFFGGGTPSLMHPKTVGAIIEAAITLWTPSQDLEITLEANPNSVEVNRFKELRQNGVNRISVGIQALNNPDLKLLGRQHSADEAMKAIETACATFDRVSFDLIYARPGQTLEAWEQELSKALTFGTTHLSLYQLTIEPGTAFAPLFARGDLVLPEENLSADMFELTQNMMERHGMPAYEISNHAKLGMECRHNLVYWRYQDYTGVGPGAHGRLTLGGKKYATRQKKSPEAWLKAITEQGHGDEEVLELTAAEQDHERLMMGLRLLEGVDASLIKLPLDQTISVKALDSLVAEKYLRKENSYLIATAAGRQRLNAVLEHLWK